MISTEVNRASLTQRITDYFTSVPDLSVVYLFGSAVTDRYRRDSDLDIAILRGREALPPAERFQMTLDLINETGCEIDLVDVHNQTSQTTHFLSNFSFQKTVNFYAPTSDY